MTGSGRSLQAVRGALSEALSLVLPTVCAGCGAPDVALCAECAAELSPIVTHRLIGGLDAWSGLFFEGVAARVIRAAKEHARTGLCRPLAPALAAAAEAVPGRGRGTIVVPVPTSRAALRRRGYRVGEILARRAALAPRRLLLPARATADQRVLTRDERAVNVAGSMRSHAVAGADVLIVDDVLTTGATVEEAARALRAAGAHVLGVATVAATPRRS